MKKHIQKIRHYVILVFGVMLVAFAISVFYTPNRIVNGGVSGISTILFHTFGIQPGVSFAAINVLLLIFAWRFLGFLFVKDTLLSAALVSVFVQLFTHVPPLTDDVLLAAVFGSVLYGVGTALTLIVGASTGGTDILGRLVQCLCPHVKIGSLLLAVDAAVIFLSLCVFKTIDLALYGIIALYLATYTIDFLIGKMNISKLAFVVTDKGVEISRYLVEHSPRGVTIIESTGAYTMDERQVLLCALKENEAPLFQKRVLGIDDQAFIIFSESQQIVGNGFRVYK